MCSQKMKERHRIKEEIQVCRAKDGKCKVMKCIRQWGSVQRICYRKHEEKKRVCKLTSCMSAMQVSGRARDMLLYCQSFMIKTRNCLIKEEVLRRDDTDDM